MTSLLTIDGSHGEGGGQILRAALCLSAITGRPIRIENIRAGRRNPGLAAQHLTAVRAVAAIVEASVMGDTLGAMTLSFTPRSPVRTGEYTFDVAEARAGGSAGAVTLVLQTVMLPLALARGESVLSVRGGTHVAWSPSFDYAKDVWLPALARFGVQADLSLERWGWYPVGLGEVRARITGHAEGFSPLALEIPGPLAVVNGRAVAANLPAHIPQRMADRARALLAAEGIESRIQPLRVTAACAGAGIFLTASYENVRAGFAALGERGKPAEQVAEEAVAELLSHHANGAAVDPRLGDQLVLPAALTAGESRYTVSEVTGHLRTMAWLVEKFDIARVDIADGTVRVVRQNGSI